MDNVLSFFFFFFLLRFCSARIAYSSTSNIPLLKLKVRLTASGTVGLSEPTCDVWTDHHMPKSPLQMPVMAARFWDVRDMKWLCLHVCLSLALQFTSCIAFATFQACLVLILCLLPALSNSFFSSLFLQLSLQDWPTKTEFKSVMPAQ